MNHHIDYAPYTITAKAKIRDMYSAANNKELADALQLGLEALVELRLAVNVLKHLHDSQPSRK